jgi:D-serine deaminase-like pyridoxal phosphate-dependent protein
VENLGRQCRLRGMHLDRRRNVPDSNLKSVTSAFEKRAMNLHEIKTPCLVLDHEKVKNNARKMRERVGSLGAKLRPHVKTHKCVEIADLQVASQKEGIAVSTLEEGRVFSAAGFTDILYAVPIEPGKFSAAIELARKCDRLRLITDDISVPPILNSMACQAGVKLDLLMEVDCGYGRTGVAPTGGTASELARTIANSSNLRFNGLLTHAGHAYHARSRQALLSIAREERDVMVELGNGLRSAGVEVPLISIGSTPTINMVDHLNGIDEARPGNYIFYDVFQASLGTCSFDDCAITVLAAIVSRDRTRRQIVCDAGAIALSKDRGPVELDRACGYGKLLDLEGIDLGVRLDSVSQEHGLGTIADEATFERLQVGMRVRILVNHSCLSAAQHDFYHVLENGEIVCQWKRHRGW